MFAFLPIVAQTGGATGPSITFILFLALMTVATYIALRRYRSRRLLMERVAELELLSGAGRSIVEAELDLAALCELIAQESSQVIDSQTFQIGLFEEDLYHIHYWRIRGQIQPVPQTYDLEEGGGIVKWIRDSKRPILVHDFERELASLPARPRYISDSPPRSAIFVPLISGEETLGVIAAQSHTPNRFSEEDMRRLMILCNQAAAAIAHARLFAQVQKRAAQLELVAEIGQEISQVQSRRELFEQVVRLTADTFGFHLVTIFGIDEETGDLDMQASNSPEAMAQGLRVVPGQGLVGTALATRQITISNDTKDDPRFLVRFGWLDDTTQSEMAIPLLVDDDLLGVLDVQSQAPGFFTHVEKMTLETLAAEVAIAISKLQQLTRQREQAWLTTAQLQVAEAIGGSNSMEEMVTAVTRLTSMLIGVPFNAILLWDEETAVYQGAALYGGDANAQKQFARLTLPIGAWHALDAVHVGQEALPTTRLPDWLHQVANELETPLSEVVLWPLVAQEQTLGVLLLSPLDEVMAADNHHGTRLRREELLDNIARQTAVALETANLRRAQQEEAWVNTALFQVAATVNSLIDLNEILATIIRLVPMLVGVESALILIWDDSNEVFQAGPSHGIGEMERGLLETLALDREEINNLAPGLMNESSVTTGTMYMIGLPDWLKKVFTTHTACAFPLVARAKLVGMMLVGTQHALSHRQTNILTGIAHQAATAVVNNQLYKEAAERDRLEQELNVAREIQTALIPTTNPHISGCEVAGYWEAARQVSGDFYDFLQLSDGKWGILIADVADKGVPAALFMALSRTILRTVGLNRINPAETLMRTNEIIDNDAQSDLFVTVFYAVWDPAAQTLAYANGGHNPPILVRKNGKSQMLKASGIALGVLPEVTIECRSTPFRPGDTLVLYTDGVTEAMNEDYDEFGINRLQLAIDNSRRKEPADVITAVTQAIDSHVGGMPQFDDITLVVLKRAQT